MKINIFTLFAVCTIFGLAGCSSEYVISTNDGHMMTAQGKPHKDKDTGLISYKDSDGTIHQVHQSDVKEIVEK
ncbi:TPA: YgdI/YgdR family lipoprotein [Enterobacter cancerogenus]|uniref:YgdI/YgdR family lipoprotein n=1 Tax=Enterobacter cancerogenus TaxID=69218 RepID=UPI00376BC5EF